MVPQLLAQPQIASITNPETEPEIFYPDCDGQPIANNTTQFRKSSG
jgi:hypothetical protein